VILCITVSICWVLRLLLFHIAGESSAPAGTDPIEMMEFYMKKAAQEERRRQPKLSKDEMPPPASLQGICFMCRTIMVSKCFLHIMVLF